MNFKITKDSYSSIWATGGRAEKKIHLYCILGDSQISYFDLIHNKKIYLFDLIFF